MSLLFDISSMTISFLCLCLPEFNSVSLLFDVSFMITVVNVYVFQR